MERYPEMDIRVTEMKTTDIRRSLLNEELDAAIIANHPEDTLWLVRLYFTNNFSLTYLVKRHCLSII